MIRPPPTIDMLPDGSFRPLPPPPRLPTSLKLGIGAVLVAAIGLSITIAAVAVWVISMLLPVIVIAGAIGWGALKYRRWQSLRGQQLRPAEPGGVR